jgi:hypothetical protein
MMPRRRRLTASSSVNDVLGLGQMVAADEMFAVPVLRVGVHAEVDADAERSAVRAIVSTDRDCRS